MRKSQLLGRGAEENFVHVNVFWLAHGEQDCPGERICWNRELRIELLNARRRLFCCVVELRSILFIIDLLQPLDDFAIEFFLNGDVRHRCGR